MNCKAIWAKMWVEVSGAMCVASSMDVLVDNMEFCSVYPGEVVARQCCDGYLMADISRGG
jgi:hypothetical protein